MNLQPLIDAWQDSATRTIALLRTLPDDAWAAPTACPGWSVRDVVAHLAAIEGELATGEGPPMTRAEGRLVSSDYTQLGVDARADSAPDALIEEYERSVAARVVQLDPPPQDPGARAAMTPAKAPWSWQLLLTNRVVDVWVHEQDIRRAVALPGGYDSPAAQVAVAVFRSSLPYVLGKKADAAPGTAVRWVIDGPVPFAETVQIGSDGRGRVTDDEPEPAVTLSMSAETFVLIAAGRDDSAPQRVTIDGDAELGERVVSAMRVTM